MSGLKFGSSKDGSKTIEFNGYLLNSKYNPMKEASNFIKKEIDIKYLNIIFGYGGGYTAKALKEQGIDPNKVLFIEPIVELEEYYTKDEYDVIFNEDLNIIYNAIEDKLSYLSSKAKVICAPNYINLFPVLYKEVLEKIKEIQRLNLVYNNTIRAFSDIWQKNAIMNTMYTYKHESINVLEKYYDSPVVVASGGPSLIKQLPLLKEIRNNIILIASGSTVSALMFHNIEPDYIVTIDGGEENYLNNFKELQVKKSELFYASTSYYKIQSDFKNKMYAFLDTREKKYQTYLKKNLGIELPNILGGGSVANFALSIARFISTGPIALIGQDLAYTNGQTHAKGNSNVKDVTKETLVETSAFETEGFYGEKVWTNYSLFSMKKSFEENMLQIENAETIFNCTEGGIKIKNIKQKQFIEFCNEFVSKERFVALYNSSKAQKDLKEYIQVTSKELQVYKEILVEFKKASRALKRNVLETEFSQSILKELDDVDAKVAKLLGKVIMERIIDPITIDVMTKYEPQAEENEKERYTRVYMQNEELYDRLYEATEQSIIYTKEAQAEARITLNKGEE
ncbi:motility associated factor glycosyltransferase family protein [Lysinibacillus sphaericus]|uniref:motility associated factor glycosyltransferase family protein n=1 Tax=Lysinibacillus sphaericus TaxID=1421 RepID=UPI003D7FFEDE